MRQNPHSIARGRAPTAAISPPGPALPGSGPRDLHHPGQGREDRGAARRKGTFASAAPPARLVEPPRTGALYLPLLQRRETKPRGGRVLAFRPCLQWGTLEASDRKARQKEITYALCSYLNVSI